ncbi:hypothetical protein [Seinonella peptonophila]|uniref:hypothetical protein n=1 Tax=Seinonella peptonophila TaxID=112248 RepID=UPI0009323F66|nr:hypothetical protein [Seinonella peptonophila]
MIMIFPLFYLLGWLRLNSHSIWPVVLLHGFINHLRTFGSYFFRHHQKGWTMVAGENGIVVIVCWTVLALVLWRKTDR